MTETDFSKLLMNCKYMRAYQKQQLVDHQDKFFANSQTDWIHLEFNSFLNVVDENERMLQAADIG